MAIATGYTPDEIRAMPLSDAQAISGELKRIARERNRKARRRR